MRGLENYDDGYYEEELGRNDKSEFEKLYKKIYRSIDEDRARQSFETNFEATDEAAFRLFRDVVNAFSSKGTASGSNSGFETTIVNPLYEFGDAAAEILLAKKQPSGVHLCFVSCNVGGEQADNWRNEINRTSELMSDSEYKEALKTHIQCSDLSIRSVQYVTLTRDLDLIDADVEVLKMGTNPDNYAIWKLIESELPDGETEDKTIKYHEGKIKVPKLEEVCRNGIDPTLVENDDIRFSLTSHPVFPLGEVCLNLYLNNLDSSEEPEEFDKSQFDSIYRNKIHTGTNRDKIEEKVDDKIERLVQLGQEYGLFIEDTEIESKDYRLRWESEDPGDIKPMVQDKYFKGMIPEETGKLAYERARSQFEQGNYSLDDFD